MAAKDSSCDLNGSDIDSRTKHREENRFARGQYGKSTIWSPSTRSYPRDFEVIKKFAGEARGRIVRIQSRLSWLSICKIEDSDGTANISEG